MTRDPAPAFPQTDDHDGASGVDHVGDRVGEHDRQRTGPSGPAPARAGASSGGRPVPFSLVMAAWAPVAAGVLRATAGLVMFAASLLTLPATMATPLLTGVSLVMLVGGVAATVKACRDDDKLRVFGRIFPTLVAVLAGVAVIVAVVAGPGAYAPRLHTSPAVRDDGTVRFAS
jgi:hypothetical protein